MCVANVCVVHEQTLCTVVVDFNFEYFGALVVNLRPIGVLSSFGVHGVSCGTPYIPVCTSSVTMAF